MEQPTTKRHRGLWAIVILGVVFLLVAGLFMARAVARAVARIAEPAITMGVDERPEFKEVWSCGDGDTKVVRIPLQGVILLGDDDGLFSSAAGTADTALKSIRRATHDPEVKAIILEVDSGGGGITASDILYKALLDFKEAGEGRKVVAVFGDVAASGAYYVAMGADYIVAHPTGITGSIGVLIESLNVRELAQKIGIRDMTIKSGANKDLMNPFGEPTEEQKAILQAVVDEMYNRFVGVIAENRKLPAEQVRKLADGRIFSIPEALKLKLVDQAGYWSDASDKTAELLGVEEVKVFRYEEHFSLSALLRASQAWNPVADLLWKRSQSRLLYLWRL
jgi:protease IV